MYRVERYLNFHCLREHNKELKCHCSDFHLEENACYDHFPLPKNYKKKLGGSCFSRAQIDVNFTLNCNGIILRVGFNTLTWVSYLVIYLTSLDGARMKQLLFQNIMYRSMDKSHSKYNNTGSKRCQQLHLPPCAMCRVRNCPTKWEVTPESH